MLGTIIGDIVGSIYERHNIKTKDFPLFGNNCHFTDDTVMTVATADALMNGGEADDFIDAYKKWGRLYPDAGYGGRYAEWILSDSREPYNSWGNGSAMRVSPCAWLMDCFHLAATGCWPACGQARAALSAEVTHNHPDGLKGALAVADTIFLCRFYFGGWEFDYGNGDCCTPKKWKEAIKEFIEKNYGYNLSLTLDEIRPNYHFDVSCQGTVPQAIIAFLESSDFEDAIRNAISLGGDSDTIAAITGGIAEAAYGIPKWIKAKGLAYLDDSLRDVCLRWRKFANEAPSRMITDI
jgi:ADP-ribosylglycohydrolase